jgi:hypothetical protein
VAIADTALSREELAKLVQLTTRKQRLLKRVLGIKTKSQHRNTAYKAGKGIRQYRADKEPRALVEYLRCGREIERLNRELADMRRARQYAAKLESEYKALITHA